MPRSEWSLQNAKNCFSAVVAAACRGTPQTVTKRGKPAVVVLSVASYRRLIQKAAEHRPSLVEHLMAMPKGEVDFDRIPIEPREMEF